MERAEEQPPADDEGAVEDREPFGEGEGVPGGPERAPFAPGEGPTADRRRASPATQDD
jgi:hypothetical protein